MISVRWKESGRETKLRKDPSDIKLHGKDYYKAGQQLAFVRTISCRLTVEKLNCKSNIVDLVT